MGKALALIVIYLIENPPLHIEINWIVLTFMSESGAPLNFAVLGYQKGYNIHDKAQTFLPLLAYNGVQRVYFSGRSSECSLM